jgi:hypothetical protein
MPFTELYGPSNVLTLAPGETKEFLHGDPTQLDGFIPSEDVWTVFVRPNRIGTGVPNSVSLIGTAVAEVPLFGVPRLRYTVRNNDAARSVSFERMSVRVGSIKLQP